MELDNRESGASRPSLPLYVIRNLGTAQALPQKEETVIMNILVINAGSSSLKYQLLDPASGVLLAKGLCERIGIDGKFTYKAEGKKTLDAVDIPMPTHSEAIQAVLDAVADKDNGVISSMSEIGAVGHRVVHGGEAFNKSVLIDDAVLQAIEDCIPLAPLHNPANLTGIRACRKVMPGVPMVAVFDTAFHQTMPPQAYMYEIGRASCRERVS